MDSSMPQNQGMTPPPAPATLPSMVPTPWYKHASVWLITVLVLIVVVGLWYAQMRFKSTVLPTPTPVAEGPNVEKILSQGKIVIGTDATFPPMEDLDQDGTTLVGYDIDLGNRIAAELGVTAEFKNITWDDLFQALLNGDIDMVLSGVTITDERRELYAFSTPYINAGQVIITRSEEENIKSTDDLADRKIGVQKETTNETEALKYTSDANVVRFDDFVQATTALVNGDVEAIFSDLTGAKGILRDHPELKIASDPFTSEFYGAVFAPDKSDLVDKVNTAIDTLRQRGILTLLKQKWLE